MPPKLANVSLDRACAGRRLALLLCVVAAALVLMRPGVAAANANQLSVMQDDDQLVYRGDAVRDATLQRMKSIGVDAVRVTVLWKNVTNGALKTSARRRRFKGDQPGAYPKANWDPYDRLVRACQTLRIGLIFNVTGPGPPEFMGHTKDRKIAASYKPNPREFYKFVKAVGTRYAGNYRDEDDARLPLPRVVFWSIWNEPNQPAWLGPQYIFSTKLHKTIPYSPVLYRELFLRGRQALANTSHGHDFILAGETAPLGSGLTSAHSPMRPARFIRELFCMSAGGSRYKGRAASARNCSLFNKFAGAGGFGFTAWAHHAYTKKLAPNRRDRSRDSITLANIGSLERLLDHVADKTKLIQHGAPIAITEFGYETNPPDPFSGLPLGTQAAYMNKADQIAYRDPRIITTAQFLLRDQQTVKGAKRGSKASWFNYQSGLFYANGKPKPSVVAYALPFNLTPLSSGLYDAWGQLRFLPTLTGVNQVLLQFRPSGSPLWNTVSALAVSDGPGFFESTTVPMQGPGAWRAVWLNPSGASASLSSREVPVSR